MDSEIGYKKGEKEGGKEGERRGRVSIREVDKKVSYG